MRLYTSGELNDIKTKLENEEKKFNVGIYKYAFARKEGYLIQRIPNKAFGLAYIPATKSLIYNYPHLGNIKESEIPTITGASFSKKLNGTNIRWGRVGNELWYGTRGTLNPARFLNNVNAAIIQNKSGIIGVRPEVFRPFREQYEPILRAGVDKGLIDDYGNFVLIAQLIDNIRTSIAPIFEIQSIVACYGELVSKFNPICVDEGISSGIYIDDADHDYQYIVFDVLSRTDDGDMVFWDPLTLNQLPINKNPNVSIIESRPLSLDILSQFMTNTKEEGVVIKSPVLYTKWKKANILAWERLVSNLSNIVSYSVTHIFEQEFSFSSAEILSGKLKELSIIDEIRKAAYEEMGNHGVSQAELVNFYISKAARNKSANEPPMTQEAAETTIERSLNDQIVEKLLLMIAPALRDNGIDKSKLYIEIPKLFAFPRGVPTFYDEKRGKYRPYEWWGKLVSNVIGRSYG